MLRIFCLQLLKQKIGKTLRDNLLFYIKTNFSLNDLPYGKKNRLSPTFTEGLLFGILKHVYSHLLWTGNKNK